MTALILALINGASPFSVGATFREMFVDFGALEELSMLTRFVIEPYFGVVVGVACGGLAITALFNRQDLRRFRIFTIAASALGLFALGLTIYGLYSPLFALAEEMGP